MRRLRQVMSIANLVARTRRGQIATLLLLAIGAALIFALATANMGRTVTLTTTQDNAADTGALLLGSQIATKSHSLWKSFGERESKCKTTSWLSTIFSALFAIALQFVPGLQGWTLILLSVAAGAAGGALGGALGGTGALQGAIQGAITGAAIGTGGAVGGQLGGALGATPATAAETALGVQMGLGVITSFPSAVGATIGATAGIGAAVGSNVFNQYVQQQMAEDAITQAAKALNGLPERDQFRENVFLTVLAQTLDDPNRTTEACYWPVKTAVTGDPFDANGNGNTQESIACFEYWWERRIATLKEGIPAARAPIEAFLNGPLAAFQAAAERTYMPGSGSCGGPPPPPPPPGSSPVDQSPWTHCDIGGSWGWKIDFQCPPGTRQVGSPFCPASASKWFHLGCYYSGYYPPCTAITGGNRKADECCFLMCESTTGTPNPCTPLTCAEYGTSCGVVNDGCGGTMDCGCCVPCGSLCCQDSEVCAYTCTQRDSDTGDCIGTWQPACKLPPDDSGDDGE